MADGSGVASKIFADLKKGLMDALEGGWVPLAFESKVHGMLRFDMKRVTAVVCFQTKYEEFVGAIVRKLRQQIAGQADATRENKVRWVLGTIWWIILSAFKGEQAGEGEGGDGIEALMTDVKYMLSAESISKVAEPDKCTTETLYTEVNRYVRVGQPNKSSGWRAFEVVDRLGITAVTTLAGTTSDDGEPKTTTAQMYLSPVGEGGDRVSLKRQRRVKPVTVEERDAIMDKAHALEEVARRQSVLLLTTEVEVTRDICIERTLERDTLRMELRATQHKLEGVEEALRSADRDRAVEVEEMKRTLGEAYKRERSRDKASIEKLRGYVGENNRLENELAESKSKLDTMCSGYKQLKRKYDALYVVKESYKSEVRCLKGKD